MMSHVRRTLSLGRNRSGVCCRTGSASIATRSGDAALVLLSRSNDVFQNLALEDWIEDNVDLQHRSILLLWRNRPAVVIGRHQNPWAECHLPAMRGAGVALARRRSGGGTVFHDLGNLNLTFFSSKTAYDRRRNLRVVTEALSRLRPALEVRATDRFDILLNGQFKISGSAARLSRKSSYHHCTLLHSADHSALAEMLRPSCPGIHSNATPSVPSPVANLQDHAPTLRWEELLDALVHQYNAEFSCSSSSSSSSSITVDPADEAAFPGVGAVAAELRSWDWTFGRTPKFRVETVLQLTDERAAARCSARLQVEVKGGVVESCRLDVPTDWLSLRLSSELSGVLVGGRFCRHQAAAVVTELTRSESGQLGSRLKDLGDAVLTVMG
ncbi:lipoyl amidotransferase LIPT1, mitochondrial [Spinachia spinachia]